MAKAVTNPATGLKNHEKRLDTRELEERVVQMYRDVAEHPEREYHFETGRALAERLGYPSPQLDAIPGAAVDSFAGVGYFLDLAAIRTGETVLDLGSGSGTDSLLAAQQTGPLGHVIGVDMTDAQLDKARRLAADAGLDQVELRRGYIEQLPVDGAAVDVVISNGVINLSPDKRAVFREVARVLRPGGRLALADIVSDRRLPEGVTCDASLWASCIGGAMQVDDYRAAIDGAGLQVDTVRVNDQYRFLSDSAVGATQRWGVKSISLLAHKSL
jgi:SAM-dependent methyltransferase